MWWWWRWRRWRRLPAFSPGLVHQKTSEWRGSKRCTGLTPLHVNLRMYKKGHTRVSSSCSILLQEDSQGSSEGRKSLKVHTLLPSQSIILITTVWIKLIIIGPRVWTNDLNSFAWTYLTNTYSLLLQIWPSLSCTCPSWPLCASVIISHLAC